LKYNIKIVEKLEREVTVKAENIEDAEEKAQEMIDSEEVILGYEDFKGREIFSAIEKAKEEKDDAYRAATKIVLTNSLSCSEFQEREIGMMTNARFDFWEEEMVVELILEMVESMLAFKREE